MPKNIYEDSGRTPKASERWPVLVHPSAVEVKPSPPPPPPPPPPPVVYERVKREGTINRHAQDLLERSRKSE